MEYQNIINLLVNTPNQPSKFKTKTWVKIDDESPGTYNKDNQIRFKTSMLRSSLCDYSDAYILAKEIIAVAITATAASAANNVNKKVIFKNSAPFTNCIRRINNKEVDNAYDIDLVMPVYNLIEYDNNYSKTSTILWQYSREEPTLANNVDITDFNKDNADTNLFKINEKITG